MKDLKSSKLISLISIPSIFMNPSFLPSIILNNERNNEDLPEPVLPTIPIFYPGSTSKLNPQSISGKLSL